MKNSNFEIHFGGPDKRKGALRDLLAERIAAVPPGGSIDWVTYYFRDRPLARGLIAASRRGVRVTLTLERKPRIAAANRQVIEMLSGEDGLGSGLRTISLPGLLSPPGLAWKPQVHEKVYCFSHPQPVAFIGSFNPSNDSPEDTPGILEKIGDHNVAYNALVAAKDPQMASALAEHVRSLNLNGSSLLYRFTSKQPRSLDFGHTVVHFWPRLGGHPIEQLLAGFGAGSRIRIAASHIRSPGSVSCMVMLAKRGARVEVLTEHTRSRVPHKTEKRLSAAGIAFRRIGKSINVPMHLKFMLVENESIRRTVFGSFNWTLPSYWLNHEIAAISVDESVFEIFEAHWNKLLGVEDV